MMASLLGLGFATPPNSYSAEEIAKWTGSDVDFIREKIGIDRRHFLGPTESSIELAASAVRNMLCDFQGVTIDDLDLLICVTQNPEYRIPHNAGLLCAELGLAEDVASFDLSLGCSGFVYSLSVALALKQLHGMNKVLIVTCDNYSRIMKRDDKATVPIFGDAAAAVLIGTDEGLPFSLGMPDFGTDGKGAMELCFKAGGARHPIHSIHGSLLSNANSPSLHMNGRSILDFMLSRVPNSIDQCLTKNGLHIAEIDLFVFHQASKYMVELLQRKMGLPADKVVVELSDVGNTVSSSIPIALARHMVKSPLSGSKVLICGFGVGLSWATNIIKFD